ncbi:hypothetical protein V8E54_001593 [Elaphomyces granulatus]
MSTLLCDISGATQIATFTDNQCKNSFRSLNGPNGYPNGTCTNLRFNGPVGSFQVVQEDTGCAVTIYGNDTIATEPCSATVLQFANVAQCYNASWVYYSIDGCSIPSSESASPNSSNTVNSGAIAGGVIGAVAGIAIIAGIFWYFYISRSGRKGENLEAPVPPPPPTFEKPAYIDHPRPPQELAAPYFEMTSNKMSTYELQAARESSVGNRLFAELPAPSK